MWRKLRSVKQLCKSVNYMYVVKMAQAELFLYWQYDQLSSRPLSHFYAGEQSEYLQPILEDYSGYPR